MTGEPPSMNCRQKNCFNIADFESAISPSSELQFGRFFFWIWVFFRKESRSGLCFCKFFTKSFRSDLKTRRPKTFMDFAEDCCKTLKLKYVSNPHSHGGVTWIWYHWSRSWGGGPQDLKSWNRSDKICKIIMPEKKREHKENKTTKKLVLLKQRITVEATLWWTICPFTNWGLLFIAFFELQYHV